MSNEQKAVLTTEPIDQLMWILSLLRTVPYFHDQVADQAVSSADWLEGALNAHLYDGVPFDRGLGLCGAKGRQPRYLALLRERNLSLTKALKILGEDMSVLLDEIDRYETRVSLQQRQQKAPDPIWSEVRKLIHAAAHLGFDLPRTGKGIRKSIELTRRKN